MPAEAAEGLEATVVVEEEEAAAPSVCEVALVEVAVAPTAALCTTNNNTRTNSISSISNINKLL
jgi:hypothetical protein